MRNPQRFLQKNLAVIRIIAKFASKNSDRAGESPRLKSHSMQ